MAFCAWCGNQVAQVSYVPCTRCGNLTNGAQRAVGGKTNPAVVILLVVFGGLFAVAVIGILAAIAIPNFLTAKQRAMQKRTMADMRSIGTDIEAYASEKDKYPQAAEVPAIAPLLKADAWGTPMRYQELEGSAGYVLGSAGADKTFEHESLTEYAPGTKTQHFDCDILYANGQFVQYPEGAQTGGQ